MTRKTFKAKDLTGLSIYQDPKKGTIFYDFITRRSFLITNSDVQTYMNYSSILPICVIMTIVLKSFFSFNLVKTILLFLALFIIAEILFRVLFIYKLTEIENYKPPKKDNIIVFLSKNYSRTRLIILIILLAILTIIMPIYAKLEHFEGINLYITCGATVISFVGLIISLIALIRKPKD